MAATFQPTNPESALRSSPIGGAGTNIRAGLIDDLDQNADVRGDKWYGDPYQIGIADKMMRDPHVRKSIQYITEPLRAASWTFEPASSSNLDREVADFCSYVFLESLNWDRVLTNVLKYKIHGFSLFEVTDDVKPIPTERFPLHRGGGQGVVVTGMHHRPAQTVKYWHQSKARPDQLEAFTQWVIGSDGEESGFRRIPADRILRFTEAQEGANFEGLPTLRSAYGAWKCRLQLMIIQMIRAERQGVGLPTIRLPEGATDEDIAPAQTILAEMRAHEKGYLILPDGYEFTWETTDGGEADALQNAIESCSRDIAYNVGAGFMLLGLTTGSGSYALAQSQRGQYELSLEGTARFVADTMTLGADGWSPVERLVAMNYGNDVALPRLKIDNMPTRDWSKILPVINQLAVTGVIVPDEDLEAFCRSVLRLPAADLDSSRRWRRGIDSQFAAINQAELEDEGLEVEESLE